MARLESQEEAEERRRKAKAYLDQLRSTEIARACIDLGMKHSEIESVIKAEAEFAKADAIDRLSTVLERMLERAEQEST